ncbi:acyltransferase family protein [Pseudactinotalea sp. HY158]|uniref:acyltransferase family protein n=1 Tax=Pseudactinotalea sp. HY158 TaxID=2654547 RepID=UPI00129CF8A5|nr:acyltransferase family protein [Pseudactinotalea sp. HY158]
MSTEMTSSVSSDRSTGPQVHRSTGPQAKLPGRFRPDVHALRALAVALVVAFHVAPTFFPGGYVGVDVFFVISGFLITGIMLREARDADRISLIRFYSRRARRILPAATTTIVVTVAAGLLLLPPMRWEGLARHALGSSLFFENWLLASESVDYLAEGQAPSLFQHYWSLSVEEQYYLVWPLVFLLLIGLAGRRGWRHRHAIGAILATVTLAGLVLSIVITSSGEPSAYFVTPTRIWELSAGGLLACILTQERNRSRPAATAGGFALILLAMLTFSGTTAFPGIAAVVPVLGSLLVIAGGIGPRRQSLFTSRPVTWLGDVSFSLYLWHWPVVVLLAALWPASPAWLRALAVLVLAGILAHLCRQWIELPFISGRLRTLSPRRVLITGTTAITVGVCAASVGFITLDARTAAMAASAEQLATSPPPGMGAASIFSQDYREFAAGAPIGVIVPSPIDARSELPEGAEGRCKSTMSADTTPVCEFGDVDSAFTVALVGDSHIEQYLPAFQQLAGEYDWHVVTYFHSSCPWSTAQRVSDADRGGPCLEANEQTLAALAELRPDLMVTSSRTALPFVQNESVPDPVTGFREAWTSVTALGIPVAVIADNPLMLPSDATNECVSEHLDDPEQCERSRDESMPQDWQRPALSTPQSGVSFIDLTDRYCTRAVCPAVAGSTLIYRDEQHVTPAFMRTLTPYIHSALDGHGLIGRAAR